MNEMHEGKIQEHCRNVPVVEKRFPPSNLAILDITNCLYMFLKKRNSMSDITMMIVLPDFDGLLTSLEKGLLFSHAEVNTTTGLHHWILQVTSGQFEHLRLVIPMATWSPAEWPTLSRVTHIDLTSKRCGMM